MQGLRRYGSLALLLLLLGVAAEASAKPVTAAIADLNVEDPTSSQLLDTIRTDLSVSHYAIKEKPELLRGLQGKLPTLDPGSKAEALLKKSQEAYEKFQLEDALRSLQSMDSLLRNVGVDARERELLAQRYLLAGLVRIAQDRSAKAVNNFRLAHRLRPSQTTLDAGSHRPAVVSMYESAVEMNTSAKEATLERAWEPRSASLYVDGQLVTPKSKLTQGPHILTLSEVGYASSSVALSLGEEDTHKARLEELSLTEALQGLRARVALDPEKTGDALDKLATLAAVDLLVLVRSGADSPLAATYDRASKSLSAWVAVGSVRWESLLSREETSVNALDLGSGAKAEDEQPWFKQWWGGGLIVGGTAIVGTAIYFALSTSDSSNNKATIDQWCFGSCN